MAPTSQKPGVNKTKWYPSENLSLNERLLFNAINDHDEAITTLNAKMGVTTTTIVRTESASIVPTGLPGNTPAIASEWINSYNAVTGAFTQTQPAFTDVTGVATAAQVPSLSSITGQITTAQLPAAGISIVIVTAALTTLGTQGSMTFTNGLLTAQVAAT